MSSVNDVTSVSADSTCPSQIELREFASSQMIDERRFSEIAAHLEVCETCVSRVARLLDVEQSRLIGPPGPLPKLDGDDFEAEAECARATTLVEALSRRQSGVSLPESIGSYRILDLFQQGGMGVTYKAWHQHLKRVVILKLVGHTQSQDPELLSQFVNEQEIIGKLNHPNIATAYDAGIHSGQPFLVMEYVEGRTLQEYIRQEETIAISTACRLARDIAVALQYVHESGFIHRDIKPANVIVTESNQAKILDFGLALTIPNGDPIENQRPGGTLNYRAPEQMSATGEIDRRADLYSLGATLFAMLSGSAPKMTSDINSAREQSAVGTLTLHEIRSDVPRDLSNYVQSLMASNPDDRPQNAKHVIDKLTHYCTDLDSSEFTVRPTRRPPRASLVGSWTWGLCLIGIGLLAGFGLWQLQTGRSVLPGLRGTNSGVAKVPPPSHVSIRSEQSDAVSESDGRSQSSRDSIEPKVTQIKFRPGPATGQLAGLALDSAKLPGIKRWQVETRFPRGAVRCLAWNSDETRLACFSDDGHVRLYEPRDSQLNLMRVIPIHGSSRAEHRSLNWDPSGTCLLAGDSHPRCELDLWHVETGRRLLEFKPHHAGITSSSWSPDGARFVTSGTDGTVRVWERDGRPVSKFARHQSAVSAVAWHPNLSIIASAGDDLKVRVWHAESAQPMAEWSGHTQKIWDLKWNPIKDQLVSCDDGQIHVWDVDSGHFDSPVHRTLDAEVSGTRQLAWRMDGQFLATAGREIRVWDDDLRQSKLVFDDPINRRIEAITWGPRTNRLTYSSVNGPISDWDPTNQRNVVRLASARLRVQDLAWNSTGTSLAIQSESGAIHLFDASGRKMGQVTAKITRPGTSRMLWSPNGKVLVTSADLPHPTLEFWNGQTCQREHILDIHSTASAVTYLANSSQILTSHDDGSVWSWSTEKKSSGEMLYQHVEGCVEIAADPTQRRLAIGDATGAVWLLDLRKETPQIEHRLKIREFPILQLSWNHQGTFLAARDFQSASLFEVTRGSEFWHLDRSMAELGNLSWAADDGRILLGLTGGLDVPETKLQPPLNLWALAATDDTGQFLADAGDFGFSRVRALRGYQNRWGVALVDADRAVSITRAGQISPSTADCVDGLVFLVEQPAGVVATIDYFEFLHRFPGYDQIPIPE